MGHCEGNVDISVLAADIRISPKHPLPTTTGGITLGQDVYFLGFPYGLTSEIGELNQNFPLPLVKKAILSAFYPATKLLLLDGHNNPGFSGGPVVFSEVGKPANQLSVAGVISGYHPRMKSVYLEGKRTPLEFEYNTGIIVAYGIKHAVDLIRQNPIGFNLRGQKHRLSILYATTKPPLPERLKGMPTVQRGQGNKHLGIQRAGSDAKRTSAVYAGVVDLMSSRKQRAWRERRKQQPFCLN